MENVKQPSKAALWTGRILSALCILFLLFDAITKILKVAAVEQGSAQLGWPVDTIQPIGIILLLCTILYIIPRTAVLGAILLTGHLGGATEAMVRAQMPGHPFLFPVIFGIVLWAGLYLRDEKLRALIPIRRTSN